MNPNPNPTQSGRTAMGRMNTSRTNRDVAIVAAENPAR